MGAPVVIGGTGGSGTRAFAAVARLAGLYTGAELNESEDALPFGRYSDRWIDAYFPLRNGHLPDELARPMRADLEATVAEHLRELPPGRRWGWKEPRSIYLLPFLRAELPGLRFVHVVRDGRDMAFSANQNQLRKHGDTVIGRDAATAEPVRSIRLWATINLATVAYAERELGADYVRLRFEDLCDRPAETVERLLGFLGLEGDVDGLAETVRPSQAGSGRWRAQAPELVEELDRVACEALDVFGYRRG